MLLYNLSTFIHTESSPLFHPSKPSATISPSPIFRRLQSFFTVCMIEDCGGIFGLVSPWPWDIGRLLHSPNIVRNLGYGWAICYHGRKLRKACARMLLNYIISRIIHHFSTIRTRGTRRFPRPTAFMIQFFSCIQPKQR